MASSLPMASDRAAVVQVIKRSSVKKQEKRSKLKVRLLPACCLRSLWMPCSNCSSDPYLRACCQITFWLGRKDTR